MQFDCLIIFHRYFLKNARVKLKAFLTSRSTFGSAKSPLIDYPCCISGNSTISKASPSTFLPIPPNFVVGLSPSAGRKNWGHLMSFRIDSSSS